MMQPQNFDTFEDRSIMKLIAAALPYFFGLLLLLALAWFVYHQWNWVGGVKIEAPSPQVISMVPPAPPPPPPPPPPEEKPPEPTEQPQPSPTESAKPEPQQPTPMAMDAAPQTASPTPYGLTSGPAGGKGAPGVCLIPPCGDGPVSGGGGMNEASYRRYLSSELQERVQGDEKLSRLVFSADFTLNVTADGRISSVQLVDARGRRDDETIRKLAAILAAVRGLNPPPQAMRFPQKITVRGRRAF